MTLSQVMSVINDHHKHNIKHYKELLAELRQECVVCVFFITILTLFLFQSLITRFDFNK